MSDFETHPVGTADRIEKLERVLEAAKQHVEWCRLNLATIGTHPKLTPDRGRGYSRLEKAVAAAEGDDDE